MQKISKPTTLGLERILFSAKYSILWYNNDRAMLSLPKGSSIKNLWVVVYKIRKVSCPCPDSRHVLMGLPEIHCLWLMDLSVALEYNYIEEIVL